MLRGIINTFPDYACKNVKPRQKQMKVRPNIQQYFYNFVGKKSDL